MKDAADRLSATIFALFFQYRQGVGAGTAGVNHQGQAQALGAANVAAKALTLPFHVCHCSLAQSVVVQAGFANAHHLGVAAHGQQIVQCGLLHIVFIRMNACSAPKIVMRQRHGIHIREGFHLRAD